MPSPDPPPKRNRPPRAWVGLHKRLPGSRRKPRGGGGEPAAEPVEPDKPRPLAGGAAAALEFDED